MKYAKLISCSIYTESTRLSSYKWNWEHTVYQFAFSNSGVTIFRGSCTGDVFRSVWKRKCMYLYSVGKDINMHYGKRVGFPPGRDLPQLLDTFFPSICVWVIYHFYVYSSVNGKRCLAWVYYTRTVFRLEFKPLYLVSDITAWPEDKLNDFISLWLTINMKYELILVNIRLPQRFHLRRARLFNGVPLGTKGNHTFHFVGKDWDHGCNWVC